MGRFSVLIYVKLVMIYLSLQSIVAFVDLYIHHVKGYHIKNSFQRVVIALKI